MNGIIRGFFDSGRSIRRIGPSETTTAEKLEDLRRRTQHTREAPASHARVASVATRIPDAEEISLPRVCAKSGLPYLAVYVRKRDGRVTFKQMVLPGTSSGSRYEAKSETLREIEGKYLSFETCPHCQAEGFGSVLCGGCKREVCYGRTDSNKFFRCTDSCKASGYLEPKSRLVNGIVPSSEQNSSRLLRPTSELAIRKW